MQQRQFRVHCELGPVLVNRTAVYRLCRKTPAELERRGLAVSCSALLARLGTVDAEPVAPFQRRLYYWSQRWLAWAVSRPGAFDKTRWLTGAVPGARHPWRLRLFLDPLYVLFHGNPQTGVVVVYDITPASDPDWHDPRVCRLYRAAFELLARSRMHLVATCRNTADQLRVNYGIAPSRLTVLPLSLFSGLENGQSVEVQPTREPREKRVLTPFLLFVGATQERRKNVAGLIQAYGRSGLHAERGIRLRIVGSHAGDEHPVVALARATPGVDLMGQLDDDALARAYEDCLGFVYPSMHEGFGIPLLEAMSRGCVCLSTITAASPEVAGDAALYVNPYSAAELIRGLQRLANLSGEERQRLSWAARQRSRLFTWERFYDGLAGVLRRQARAA
jgi:glycosyltransferase involved in cell wall biosynthesis